MEMLLCPALSMIISEDIYIKLLADEMSCFVEARD